MPLFTGNIHVFDHGIDFVISIQTEYEMDCADNQYSNLWIYTLQSFKIFAEFNIIPFHLKFRQYNVNSSQSRNLCPIYMSRFSGGSYTMSHLMLQYCL